MLNILVCVKQVPDINLVKMDPVTGSLIRAGVPAILNPLDANALEAARPRYPRCARPSSASDSGCGGGSLPSRP